VDEDDLINRELWEKSLQSARRPGQPMTLNPPKDRILLSTIIQAFAAKKALLVMYKCRRPAKKAFYSLATLKIRLLKKLKSQLQNAKRGQKKSSFSKRVYKALKSMAKTGGKTFKAIEKAAGCMANQFGFKAYSISGEFFKVKSGISSAKEIGIGRTFGSNFSKTVIFYGKCNGLKTEIKGFGKALTLGFWKDLASIPGVSYAASVGLSTGLKAGGADMGLSVGAVVAEKNTNSKWYSPMKHIGTVMSIGLGAGTSLVDIEAARCKTTQLYPKVKSLKKVNKGWCSCELKWFKNKLKKNHCRRGYRPKTKFWLYKCKCECK